MSSLISFAGMHRHTAACILKPGAYSSTHGNGCVISTEQPCDAHGPSAGGWSAMWDCYLGSIRPGCWLPTVCASIGRPYLKTSGSVGSQLRLLPVLAKPSTGATHHDTWVIAQHAHWLMLVDSGLNATVLFASS